MNETYLSHVRDVVSQLSNEGFYKNEKVISSPQSSSIVLAGGKEVLNFCANNYLGLANDPRLIAAAKVGLDEHGFGLASVRFICGTQDVHRALETTLAGFLEMDDAILYTSCFDANGGLFETLFDDADAIISDELNHASIIDGIRLSKSRRYRYKNNDLADLELRLQEADAAGARFKLIATDGVFSMDGITADLAGICDLADKYSALVMVDDSHAVGFLGALGRGTLEHCGVLGRVDIVTGTLGKALGGASGGYIAATHEVIDLLRQRSRPYLFSNTLSPSIAHASIEVIKLLASEEGVALRQRLHANSAHFRSALAALGFDLIPGDHPIVPVMLGDAKRATGMASALLEEGVYVVGFSYPVVPKGRARIRTQISAAHTREQLDFAIEAFRRVGKALGII